jgi:uncharacterized membrane protein YsdA (DUF1294 family)
MEHVDKKEEVTNHNWRINEDNLIIPSGRKS